MRARLRTEAGHSSQCGQTGLMPTTSEADMKMAIRAKLFAQLAELERQSNGGVTRTEKLAVNICSKRVPAVTKKQ